jgi:hypothetical protein
VAEHDDLLDLVVLLAFPAALSADELDSASS